MRRTKFLLAITGLSGTLAAAPIYGQAISHMRPSKDHRSDGLARAETAATKAETDALEARKKAEATKAFLDILNDRLKAAGQSASSQSVEFRNEVEAQLKKDMAAADVADRNAVAARDALAKTRKELAAFIPVPPPIIPPAPQFDTERFFDRPNKASADFLAARRAYDVRVLEAIPTAPLERDVSSIGLAGQLTMAEGGSRVALKYSWPINAKKLFRVNGEIVGDRPMTDQLAFELSAKLKDGDAILGSSDGFGNDAKFKISYSRAYSRRRSRAEMDQALYDAAAIITAICQREVTATAYTHDQRLQPPPAVVNAADRLDAETDLSQAKANCTSPQSMLTGVKSAAGMEALSNALWGVPDPLWDWTITASIGHASDEYRDLASLDPDYLKADEPLGIKSRKTDGTPWSIGGSAGVLLGKRRPEGVDNRRPFRLAALLEMGEELSIADDNKDQIVCPTPDQDDRTTHCVTTNLAPLDKNWFVKLGAEFRWDMSNIKLPLGIAPKASWNFSRDRLEYDVPISFVTSATEGLHAGAKLFGRAFAGEDTHFAVGLFVGTRFKVAD